MPQQNETAPSPLVWMLILAASIWCMNSCSLRVPVPPNPDDQHETDPQPVVSQAESEYWSAIAQCVDRSTFGTLQQHTDHLLSIVDLLKTSGAIKDDSRVAGWRAKRIEITDANRAEIAAQLRGK